MSPYQPPQPPGTTQDPWAPAAATPCSLWGGDRGPLRFRTWEAARRRLGFTCFEPFSAPGARRLVSATLDGWGLIGHGRVAGTLADEVVTGALRRGRGPVRLTLSHEDGLLHCEVEDTASPSQGPVTEERERELYLLDQVACCWGVKRTPTGEIVWFGLPTGKPGKPGGHRRVGGRQKTETWTWS
ncbi:hypothetical protein AB0395_32625 [Streptosporangium sp. NPDC051023]|uniref:hypothetical protein n=1 Tax=Streptosporangium sp. NPDC051023 TaxID=3155410 RepID=UPI0034509F9A